MAFGKKSGDSKLADAEAAREKERLGEGPNERDPREMLADLPNELQDAAEQKLAAGDVEGAAKTNALLQQLVGIIERQEKRILSLESTRPNDKVRASMDRSRLLECPICHQKVKATATGRGVCVGIHVPVFVAPDQAFWKAFQGVRWNGAHYIGRCLIPPTIVNGVMSEVRRWQQKEQRKFIKGGKIFGDRRLGTGEFNTGSTVVGATPII